ncbi:MAG: shikimate synthase [Bdellovibrionaceae bacterium]|nr:shikimate synthase [Pseudobdellovibrionaceae bacterium]
MITVIIGQRGVGKTQLLKRIHRYIDEGGTHCFDLDQEIEKTSKKTVAEIFATLGEGEFRELEKKVFSEIRLSHSKAYIAVGAGFPVGLIPNEDKIIWLQRPTDKIGRVFLDRPRLNADVTPLQEYTKRALSREMHFKNVYDQIYIMSEGLTELHPIEEDFLIKKKRPLSGGVTITSDLFFKKSRWQSFVENYGNRGVDFFEIRNDLLNYEQQQMCLGSLFSERFIYSFRDKIIQNFPQSGQISFYDWALELGPVPEPVRFLKQRLIISLHELNEGESFEQGLDRLMDATDKGAHLKFSPYVHNYEDLFTGYLWQQEDPKNRSFLPRSPMGRWGWFRLWMKGRQILNFWREGLGANPDQPTLFEWQSVHMIKTTFAAVLGSPVIQSWTPIEQYPFFEERNEPVFRIHVDKIEWNRALKVLATLGLRQAAVTSPLKEEAFHTCQNLSLEGEEFRSVNTLFFNSEEKAWHGHNTDVAGFESLVEDLKGIQNIAVWGGGGTLKMIKKVLPQVVSFSSSRGTVREEDQHRLRRDFAPEVVIWAAPPKDLLKWPLSEWKPRLVVDLNYAENSPGREYALNIQSEYRSGIKMFRVQAQYQRDFWESQQ